MEEPCCASRGGGRRNRWVYTRREIEECSPSRRDGISLRMESEVRSQFCSFIRHLGTRLRQSSNTTATAIVICQQFYMRQSLAKNDWQTIATACVFLASKIKETPAPLNRTVRVSFEMMFSKGPGAAANSCSKETFEKRKALILSAELLVLRTMDFEFDIRLPHKYLFFGMKNLGITHQGVQSLAWKYVYSWHETTLALYYNPEELAAGSLYLAAKLKNFDLPLEDEHHWRHQFLLGSTQFDAITQHMDAILGSQNTASAASTSKGTFSPVSVFTEPSTSSSTAKSEAGNEATGRDPSSVQSNASRDQHCRTGGSTVAGKVTERKRQREAEGPALASWDCGPAAVRRKFE